MYYVYPNSVINLIVCFIAYNGNWLGQHWYKPDQKDWNYLCGIYLKTL